MKVIGDCFKKRRPDLILLFIFVICLVRFFLLPCGMSQTPWEDFTGRSFETDFTLTYNQIRHLTERAPRSPGKRPLKTETGDGTPQIMHSTTLRRLRDVVDHKDPTDNTKRCRTRASASQVKDIQSLTAYDQDESVTHIRFDPSNGTPAFIKFGRAGRRRKSPGRNKPMDSPEKAAADFLMENRRLLKLADPLKELKRKREWRDDLGTTHYRYQQTYRDIPVWGREVMLHLDEGDSVYLFQGRYEPTPRIKDATPGITGDDAISAAAKHLGIPEDSLDSLETGLVFYPGPDGRMLLAYQLEITPDFDERWTYFIDAGDGSFIHRVQRIRDVLVSATGTDLHSHLRGFRAWFENGKYYLVDPTLPLADPPYSPVPYLSYLGNTYILDRANMEYGPFYFMESPSANSYWDPAGVSAMYHIRMIYEYYQNTHLRKGIDDHFMSYFVVLHYVRNGRQNTAFWNGRYVALGDGDDRIYANLAGALDVIAHEVQHGVTEYTAGLIYENESGALDEAYSDIFACMVDRDDWTMGEDAYLPFPGYCRNLAHPELCEFTDPELLYLTRPYPTRMSEYYHLPADGAHDYGGVHINMSIPSRAAYLMAEGLTAEGMGKSIGRHKTERIFYRALTTYLFANARFLDARNATLQAAEDLYGEDSPEVGAVQAGWDAVEVHEGYEDLPGGHDMDSTDPIIGQDLMIYLWPGDGSNGGSYDPNATYDLYVQTIPEPFTGYDMSQDSNALNNRPVHYSRPAAYTDSEGTLIWYAGTDHNLYAVAPDGSNHAQFTSSADIHSFAISPDGHYFAYTSIYKNDHHIYVGDLDAGSVRPYPVISQTGTDLGKDVTHTILYPDSLAFDYTGRIILFDALNCLETPEHPCEAGEGSRYFSAGFLNIATGTIFFPFENQDPAFDIGYPVFASNNDYVIAFDRIDHSRFHTDGTILSEVCTYDFVDRVCAVVGSPGLGPRPWEVWGVPSFRGDDDYITMQMLADSGTRAYRIPMDGAWGGDTDQAEILNEMVAAMPVMHRKGARPLMASLYSSAYAFDFGRVEVGKTLTKDLVITNHGNRDIRIERISISNKASFMHHETEDLLPREKSLTVQVKFSPVRAKGTESATLSVISDADVPSMNISLTGTSIPRDKGSCFIATLF